MITKTDADIIRLAIQQQVYSHDLDTKVGCCIIAESGRCILHANQLPSKLKVTEDRVGKPLKYTYMEHAERAAIYTAAQLGVCLHKATIYVTLFPCAECARAIISVGIARLVCPEPNFESKTWGESFKASLSMLKEAKVKIEYYNPKEIRIWEM